MARSRKLPTLIAFAAVALALAATVALLPQSKKDAGGTSLLVNYNPQAEPSAAPGQENVFDFLKFQIDPLDSGSSETIFDLEKAGMSDQASAAENQNPLVRSPTDSVVVVSNESTNSKKITESVEREKVARETAVKSGELGGCDAITNERAANDCRGEIYFQQAIAAKDISLCRKIESASLESRCQTYLNLISSDAAQN
ncbi:MAG: hypothetical protein V1936_01855 [Patescibacteria group bacterium]